MGPAKLALRALPHGLRLELICRLKSKHLVGGPFACNVCEASFAVFRPRPSLDAQRQTYSLPQDVDPYDNPLDHMRGEVRNICPQCGETERERFLFLLLDRFVKRDSVVVHTAAGPFAQRSLRKRCRYVSTDFNGSPVAMRKEDLCDLSLASESVDVLISFHVLEHIPDDRKALREIRRVLKPRGVALLCVPMVFDQATQEDLSLDRVIRLRRFGHPDHFRLYGHDFSERVAKEGFGVQEHRPSDVAPEACKRLGLLDSDRIFSCVRQ